MFIKHTNTCYCFVSSVLASTLFFLFTAGTIASSLQCLNTVIWYMNPLIRFKIKLKFVTLLSYLYQQNLRQFDMIYWIKNFLARFKSWHFRLSLKKILFRKFRRRVVDEPYQQYLSQFDIYIMNNNFLEIFKLWLFSLKKKIIILGI